MPLMNSFSAGAVVGRSLSIWFKNIIPFSILLLLVNLPIVIYMAMAAEDMATMASAGEVDWVTLSMVLLGQLCLGLIATGAVTYGVFQQLRGQHASIGSCLAVGLGRLFPVIGVGLLTGLVLIGACLPFILIAMAGSFLSILGVIGGLVAAIIVYCMLWVSVPVAIVERPGVFASLRRSRELTRGNKASIFGILFLLGLITGGVSWLIMKILGGILSDPIQVVIADTAIDAILGGIVSVAAAVGYHDLRADKEGVGIDELVKVFE
jgi:hypothetical protein